MTSKSENSLNIAEMNRICDSDTDEDIFLSFEKDLLSDSELSSEEASHKLEMFLKKYQKDVPNSLCTSLKKSSASNIKPLVVDILKTQITSAVMKNKDSASTIFTLTNCDDEDFSFCLLAEACETLPKDVLKKLLCDVIIPEMFNLANVDKDSQDLIINLAFHLIKKFPITNLSNQEVKLFTSKLSEKYIKVLEKLREQNYSRWHDLWMFLIRFSAKHLHSAMDLANKLLRVVEFAFRNPSYEQRLKGYECWKELIDNASLDMNHMCSSKQIKLLVTPLRAKFSKMEVVICKRFEVFLYLLEKLQDHSILCLNEFLEFCFGVTTNVSLSSKNGQGKLVPNLWLKSIEVFLAILGDQKHIFESSQKIIFEKTIINEKNLANFKHVLICSVIESSIILKHISIDATKKVSILFSLWESLFNIVLKSSQELQEKCFQIIFSFMVGIFKEFNEDLTYVGMLTAFVPLLESNIDYRLISDAFKLLVEKAVRFLIENNVSDEVMSQFSDVMQTVCQDDHLTEFVFEQIKKVEVIKNKKLFFQMWSTVGAKMVGDLNNHKNIIVPCFLWPVRHLEQFDDQLSTETCSVWLKLYVQVSKMSDDYKKSILSELQRSFMSNPLLSSNISNLISTLSSDELTFDEQYVNILLKLMADIMAMPLLPQDCAKKMVGVLVRCIGEVASSSGNEVDLTNVDNICECIEKLPVQERKLAVLEELDKLVDKIVNHASSTTAKRVKNLITTFSGPSLSKRASKIAMRLNTPESSNGHSPGSTMKRSVRMTHMVIEKPHEPVDKINSLQFFGKDVEQVTPVKVKGSLLQTLKVSSPTSRSKKMVNSIKKRAPEPPSVEDSTNDFVLIDTEVKVEKDKLTEHQKEELKRRREDIPALYQDLSQSQSHTQSSNASKSPSADSTVVAKDLNPTPAKSTEEVGHFTSVGGNVTENEITVDVVKSVEKKKSKSKDELKRERELLKIQMDIVGGNTFLQELPSKRPRRSITLAASKQKKGDQKSENESENEESKNVDASKDLEKPVVILSDLAENSREVSKETDEKDLENSVGTPTSSTSFCESDSSKADTPNNRKNKFIKPKKFISTGSKSKIKIKLSGKGMLVKKKRPSDDGTFKNNKEKKDKSRDQSKDKAKPKEESDESKPKHKTKVRAASEDERKPDEEKEKSQGTPKAKTQESEILFASELDSQRAKTNKKRNEEAAPNISGAKTEIPSKRPKEIMKKNKEKVKTIQSQLKLANLGDLSTSSEPKKAKSAKLIFIREITNSTNGQDAKVAAAGLKRNKDNKSKNIAYTIERPATPVPLSSLNLLESVESVTQAEQEESDKKSERLSARKRKKTTSESDASVSSSTSSCGEGTPKRKRSKSRRKVDDGKEVASGVQKDCVPPKPEAIVETSPSMVTPKTSKDKKPKQSDKILSPADSPSRILRSRSSVASPLPKDCTTEKPETNKAVKSLFAESEDVIESSQDSLADKSSFSIGNLSRSLTKFGVKDVVEEPKKIDEEMAAEPPMAKAPLVSQADTETCDSNYETHPAVIQLEVPTKPELTNSEILLSLTETVSLVSPQLVDENMDTTSDFKLNLSAPDVAVPKDIEGAQTSSGASSNINNTINSTPKKSNEDLPGSPVSNVTPTLTKELMDNTLDISPINLHTATNENAKQNCEEKLDEMLGSRKSTSEEEAKSAVFSGESKLTGELFQKNLRSTKLLNMVNVETPVTNVETPVTQKRSGKRVLSSPAPMKSRYEKLFSFFDGNKQDDKGELKECDDSAGKEDEEDLLTFSREVPSPFATPSSSILKRKLGDTDDGYSPCAKRKRVNFSYPCISSTKLYIRHKEEMIPHFRMSFPQNFMGIDLDDENSDEDDPFAYHRPGEEVGTEESLELTNPLLLCGKKPIYEQLTDCTETLGELWKRLSSPMYCEVLKKVLQDKDIHTVGDLAQLTESEINRLPFKQPRIKTVRKALNYYYNAIYKKAKRNVEPEDASPFDSRETSREMGVLETEIEGNDTETTKSVDTHKPLDIRDEFANILKRMKDEKQPLEEFGTVFLDFVDESEVVGLLRTVYNTDFRRFFERSHWEFMIRNIVQSGGVSDLFDIISDLAENNTLLANQLEKIVQLRVTQNPLSDIIKKRTLEDLRDGISECVRDEVFQREDVLKTCFLPLVKDPKDVKIYFNTLTIVQINELFVERIQPSDLGLLFEQLNEHYGNYTIAQHVNKNDVLKICSGDDLVNSIVEKKNVVESIKQLISKLEDRSELSGLYDYIGELLPVKSRIDSHISFLRILASDNRNAE